MNIITALLSPATINLIQYILVPLIIILIDVFLLLTLKRLFPKLIIVILSVFLILSSAFALNNLFVLLVVFYFMAVMLFVFGNIVEYRWLISNAVSPKERGSKETSGRFLIKKKLLTN